MVQVAITTKTSMKTTPIKLAIFATLIFCYQAASAATLYRCGNSFQDTPCLNGASSKPVKTSSKAPSTSTLNGNLTPYSIDADCKERGQAAKKIMWSREVGKTQEQQLESSHDAALVKEVYNQRGTTLEVQSAVEQQCMKQKDQDDLANRLLIEAQRLKGNTSQTSTNLPTSSSSPQVINNSEPKVKTIDVSELNKKIKANCVALEAKAEDLARERRKGASASRMNQLKQQQHDLESTMKSAGC